MSERKISKAVYAGFGVSFYSDDNFWDYLRTIFLSSLLDRGMTEDQRQEMITAASNLMADLKVGCPVLWDGESPVSDMAKEWIQERHEWYAAHSGPGSNDFQEAQ